MPRQVKGPDGIVHSFPDDATDEEIGAALNESAPETPAGPPMGGWLPTAGGMVGSLVGTLAGPPGRLAGAAAGGALGKGAEMLLDDQPQSFGEGMRAMGGAALGQGAAEGLGMGAGKLLKAGAPRLYQSMLKPAAALRAEFPTVVNDAIDAGVGIGGRGIEKVGKLIRGSSQQVSDRIALMQRAGAPPVDMKQVVGKLVNTEQKIGQEPMRAAKLGQLSDIRSQVLSENPHPIPLVEAQKMKQGAQRVASQGYRQINSGADINRVPLDANMDIAGGLKEAIEQRVPGVGALNAHTQRLMGVEDALTAAEGRISNNQPIGMNALIASGVGAGTYGASGDSGLGTGAGLGVLALTNPYLASRLAIGADRFAPMASHIPNAARVAALLAALTEQQAP